MNDIYVGTLFSEDYLVHHGVLGMKWGVRRYQREDGSLTSAGRKHKLVTAAKAAGNAVKKAAKEGGNRLYDQHIGKSFQEHRALKARRNALESTVDNFKAAKKRKTLGGKMSELVGAGAKKRAYENEAKYYNALAKEKKSDKYKQEAERNARNSKQMADYFDKVNKGERKDTLKGRFNIPYEKANGKMTTRGKDAVASYAKRQISKEAVKVGLQVLGAVAASAAARRASDYSDLNVVEVQTLEDFSRRGSR